MPDLSPSFAEFLASLERSSVGEIVRLTPNLYPVLMSAHVIGIALLVGSALAVDARLLGVGRNSLPVTTIARFLLPMSHLGFAIVAITGIAMFFGIAVQVGSSAAAPWKFGLIGVAAINIIVFHKGVYRSVEEWDLGVPTPMKAKVAAVVSACAWIGVVFGGRFLAY